MDNNIIRTKHAYLWWALGIGVGYIWATFFINAPFVEFISVWTLGFLGISAKNLIQKKKEYNGQNKKIGLE